ncbi:polysulfide reductase NrfD [Haloactinopolyspora alba]|uniref:Polysulfide reductase NrfD n=2 Tax=Haloactinopolyspora alba TaxID=648780 RepID=A0A2P8E8X4_9ACTN|nr:polysulfide reductase NrfD [Haloactinopolyspora alba]
MVPDAEFRSYYGQPVIKAPTWKTPDVPVYFFLGGLAGASSAMAVLGEATGRARLARTSGVTSAAAAAGGTVALVHDLGRPERFLNMLRVFKPTSPLNIGSWVLAVFGTMSGAAAASTVTGLLPGPARVARAGAGLLSPVMMTYTAVLVADTAVPAWHEGRRELPFMFAGGSLIAGAGAALTAVPPAQAGPARAMATVGTGLELAAERRMTSRLGMLAEPYEQGRPARWMRAGQALAVAGAAGAVLGRRSRLAGALSGAALLAGSLCTRFGVFEAGMISAKDPKYTVVPQRERLNERASQPVTAAFVAAER